MSNPTNDVFWVNESKDDPDSVAHANDWIYIQHEDKEPSVIRYDLFVRQVFPGTYNDEMFQHAVEQIQETAHYLDCAKKPETIITLIGAIRFYLRALQNLYNISDQKILQTNADNLSDRYKELTYTDAKQISGSNKKEGKRE
jgi:hypothetical protein